MMLPSVRYRIGRIWSRGFFQNGRNFWLNFTEQPPKDEVNPYIKLPILTNEIMKKIPQDKYQFDFSYASFGYHSKSSLPMIHSLSDLTEPTQLNTLLPRTRPQGSPSDTLSIKAGDDAMLVSPTILAVADGVTGWESANLDADNVTGWDKMLGSGIWSRSMLETVSRLMTEWKINQAPHYLSKRDLDQIIDDSFLHTSHLMDLQNLKGSLTLILSMITGDLLQLISIGDSKLFIIRDNKIIKTNDEQMISPLCPQQIGTQTLNNIPSQMAWMDHCEIQIGDLVLVCTDGITDNLYDWEILKIINDYPQKSLKFITSKILIKAKESAFDDYAYTPHNEKLNNLPGKLPGGASQGGKIDDMSIAMGRVELKKGKS